MPTEIRHVLFRPNEVVAAIIEFYRRMQSPLPPGSILRTSLEEFGGNVGFGMVIEGKDGTSRQKVTMDGAQLTSALILYCRDHGVPLPSDSAKSLRKLDEWLALVITRNPRQEVLPDVAQDVAAAARLAARKALPAQPGAGPVFAT